MHTSFALQIQAIVKHDTLPDTHVYLSANFVPVCCFWSYLSIQASLALHSVQASLALHSVQTSLALHFASNLSDLKFYTSLSPPDQFIQTSLCSFARVPSLTFLYQFSRADRPRLEECVVGGQCRCAVRRQ